MLTAILLAALVPAVAVDLRARRIPDAVTVPAALAALAVDPSHLLAGAATGGFFLAAALARPEGMGLGDVKLAAVIGLCRGDAVAPAILVALLAGAVTGVLTGARTLPFAPFLALGALVSLVAP